MGRVPLNLLSGLCVVSFCETAICGLSHSPIQGAISGAASELGRGGVRGSTVFNPDQVKSCGWCGAVGFGFSSGGEQLGDPLDIRSAGSDPDNCAGQHSDHTIQKAASFELESNQFLSVLKADPVNGADGRGCCLKAIRGKRGKVVGADQLVSGGAQNIEVEIIRNVPGPADF